MVVVRKVTTKKVALLKLSEASFRPELNINILNLFSRTSGMIEQ